MSLFRSFDLFRVRGIPVRVHSTLLLFLLIAGVLFSPGAGLLGFAATVLFVGLVFGFVLLHELGHAVVAQWHGIPVLGITLHPLGGVARLAYMPRAPRQELQIALAGPAVNFALAGLFSLLHILMPIGLLQAAVYVNLVLGLFNLLPAFPLDGGRVLRALLARRRSYADATRVAARVGQGVAVLMGIVGLAIFHPMLIMIAVFVFFAAQAEMRAATRSPSVLDPYTTAAWTSASRPYPRSTTFRY